MTIAQGVILWLILSRAAFQNHTALDAIKNRQTSESERKITWVINLKEIRPVWIIRYKITINAKLKIH